MLEKQKTTTTKKKNNTSFHVQVNLTQVNITIWIISHMTEFDRPAGVTKCMHRTAPGKIQYRTDEKSRFLPTNFYPKHKSRGVFLCLKWVD